MAIRLNDEGQSMTLYFDGRFDFSVHRELRENLDQALQSKSLKKVVFDLGGVTYVDSAAMGMLLIARERAGQGDIALSLRNARKNVRDVLAVAKFDTLFQFE